VPQVSGLLLAAAVPVWGDMGIFLDV